MSNDTRRYRRVVTATIVFYSHLPENGGTVKYLNNMSVYVNNVWSLDSKK